MGTVAGAYRSRALVSGQPLELELGETTLATDPVHGLQRLRVTGGRAQQPLAPAQRLALIAADHEGLERQGRVAHPAVAVVPVARAAERLRQRRGRRRDDAAGRLVRQRLQGEQRAQHRLAPFARVLATRRPVRPGGGRVLDERARVFGNPARLVRGKPTENERNLFAGRDRELGRRRLPTTVEVQRRAQLQAVGTGNGAPTVVDMVNPGDDRAVVEPHDELDRHVDLPVEPLDEPHEQRTGVPERETVDDPDPPRRGLVLGLEHHRARAVTAGRASAPSAGAIEKRPCSGVPSSAAKHAGASKRGAHHQSTDPARETSAAVRRSPRSA